MGHEPQLKKLFPIQWKISRNIVWHFHRTIVKKNTVCAICLHHDFYFYKYDYAFISTYRTQSTEQKNHDPKHYIMICKP